MMLKKLLVPFTNKIKFVDAVQLWEVRWTSRHGSYSSETNPEVEVFTEEELAIAFRESLRNAFKLIKYTSSGTRVRIVQAK